MPVKPAFAPLSLSLATLELRATGGFDDKDMSDIVGLIDAAEDRRLETVSDLGETGYVKYLLGSP